MKFSLVLVLALIGMILFGVFYDNKRIPGVAASPAAPPSAASSLPSAASPLPSPTASSPSLLSKLLSSLPHASSAQSSSGGQSAATLFSFFRSATASSITPRSALMIAHGTVSQKLDAGIVLDCTTPYINPASKDTLSGGPVSDKQIRRAKLAREAEARRFGPLTCVHGGTVQASDIDPGEGEADKYVTGAVLLVGYPADAMSFGKGVNVVVAPLSPVQLHGDTYQKVTATFTTEPATPTPDGWWMWHKREATTALER